jgi:integrase
MASLFRRIGSSPWQLKWFDAQGKRCQKTTGTTDKRLAERMRRDLERELAARAAGLVDDRAIALQSAAKVPIETHIETYLAACGGAKQAKGRLKGKQRHLSRAVTEMHVASLSDFASDSMRAWLFQLRDEGLAPITVNEYRVTVNAFLNWCVKDGLVKSNVVKHVASLPTHGERRRNRRALEQEEVQRLLDVALSQDSEHQGLRWAPRHPVYVMAVYAGLRHGELKRICWRDVDVKAQSLRIRDDVGKARRVDEIPLHPCVIEALGTLPPGGPMDPVFGSVPTLKTFRRDCERAGITLLDDQQRTIDFHSLRMTLATRLQREGVHASIAQRIMRHASFKTTDKYYTDLRLHDLSEAISRLSGPAGPVEEAICQATGTDDAGPVRCHQNRHHSVHETVQSGASGCESDRTFMSASPNDKPRRKAGLCDTVQDRAGKRVNGFEPSTFTLAT